MKSVKILPLAKPIQCEVTVPGCIGYTIRALNIAAMTKGSVKIADPLKSDDVYHMVDALNTLGIKVEEGEDFFIVHGDVSDVKNKEYTIDVGLSGRTARTILALLSIVPGNKLVTCSESFKKRPMADLVDGLKQMGAEIEYLDRKGYLPVMIRSSALKPGSIEMNGNLSSQYFSAIMMIAPVVGKLKIKVKGPQSSKPFIDMTIGIMKDFGVNVKNDNYKYYTINKDQQYKNNTYHVEPEATSAGYFFAIAAVTKSKIKILGLDPNSLQGDLRFADILEVMGCTVKKDYMEKTIEVTGGDLSGINVDLNDMPDIVDTLAVIAAFAKGETKITNIAHIRKKESDRIEAPKTELKKMGIKTKSTNDSLTVHGGIPIGCSIDTYEDHRMAMSFAIAGTTIPGIVIKNSEVVSKSFPNFWKKLEEIGIKIERINK